MNITSAQCISIRLFSYTTLGEKIPDGDMAYIPLREEELNSFQNLSVTQMNEYVVRGHMPDELAKTNLMLHATGVDEVAILGPSNALENIPIAKVGHLHGFHFRKLVFKKDGRIPVHARDEEEVIFVHEGRIALSWDCHTIKLGKGDTLTIPKGIMRDCRAMGDDGAVLFVVRGGDAPRAPRWGDDQSFKRTNAA